MPQADINRWAEQVTTDAYADLGSAWRKVDTLTTTIVVSNTGAIAAQWKVLGSVDGVNYVEVIAEQALAAGATGKAHVADYYTHLKIQVKDADALDSTTVSAQAAAYAG